MRCVICAVGYARAVPDMSFVTETREPSVTSMEGLNQRKTMRSV